MEGGEKGACEGASKGHRDTSMEARGSRRHPTMKDAESLGEQAEAVKQEVRRSRVYSTEE
jgi:hypothetical protein